MNKADKNTLVQELNETFSKSAGVLLLDFTGINVADETELRRQVSRADSRYRVVKNTLALRAAKDTAVESLETYFSGPTAIAYTDSNVVGLAKALSEFLKAHPNVSFKAGVLDQTVLSAEDVKALAQMPSREELLSKVLYLLQAPLTQLAGALRSPLQNLASVLKQIGEREGSN